jgi:hypothetical protein
MSPGAHDSAYRNAGMRDYIALYASALAACAAHSR